MGAPDEREGLHLLSPTAQDTLDFTGPAMNSGSRLVMLACRRGNGPLRAEPPPLPPAAGDVHAGLQRLAAWGPAFLMAQLSSNTVDIAGLQAALAAHPVTGRYLFHVLLSPDVPMDDSTMVFWGWFTRFDPLLDLHPAERLLQGNRLVLRLPILIDARWKKGYPRPVEFDPRVERRVDERWTSYGIPG
jgi:3-polyprenyl-4-hydroxybenzoate decarboxylase